MKLQVCSACKLRCEHSSRCYVSYLESKGEGGLAVLDGGEEASDMEGGRNLHKVSAAQPANRISSLNLPNT